MLRRIIETTTALQERWAHAQEVAGHSHHDTIKAFLGKDLEKRITDSPLGAALFAFNEAGFLFEPDLPIFNADPSPELKHPTAYGLEGFNAATLRGPNNEQYLAWYKEAAPGKQTVAYCHGIGGALDVRREILKQLADKGLGVMIVAYPGFKGSKTDANGHKQTCSQAGCMRAGFTMIKALEHPEAFGLNMKPVQAQHITLFGESLGGAVALHTARRMELGHKRLNGKTPWEAWQESREDQKKKSPQRGSSFWSRLQWEWDQLSWDTLRDIRQRRTSYTRSPESPARVICFGAFSSLKNVVHDRHKRLLAERMENPFNSEDIIGHIRTPVVLLHGTDDISVLPYHAGVLKRRGDAGGADVTVIPLEGVNHWLAPPGTTQETLLSVPNMDSGQVHLLLDHVERNLPNGYQLDGETAGTQSWEGRAGASRQGVPHK